MSGRKKKNGTKKSKLDYGGPLDGGSSAEHDIGASKAPRELIMCKCDCRRKEVQILLDLLQSEIEKLVKRSKERNVLLQ